jgi:UDP-N-acetylmuramoylalanine--D-glutamate ligase
VSEHRSEAEERSSHVTEHVLVVGLGVSGKAVIRALKRRGVDDVVAVDDRPGSETRTHAGELGVELIEAPDRETLAGLVGRCDLIVPSPGVPFDHPVFALAAARDVPVRGELELASRWTDRPVVAVTGTNGKTTVTTLVTEMLTASGIEAVASGNIGLALSDAVATDAAVFVVETSSFQLTLTDRFRPTVSVWLNAAADHLDIHRTFEDYVAAKARIWANQRDADVAVVNADDPVVMRAACETHPVPAEMVTFGRDRGDYRVRGDALSTPDGEAVVPLTALGRALPHDVANALAAVAAAIAVGASIDGARAALLGHRTLPHRLTLVGEAGGVEWYDDSKATNPHAALAAIAGFESVVLIAGGQNKGLDLSALAEASDRIRAVVAIGEATAEVEAAFHAVRPVVRARSMRDAVTLAAQFAQAGDTVLLSPACASFDWYANYGARGDDYAAAVRELLGHRTNARSG